MAPPTQPRRTMKAAELSLVRAGRTAASPQRRRRQMRNATTPTRPMATSVRLAGSGTDAAVGGVTNVSKVVICEPTLKELRLREAGVSEDHLTTVRGG